MKIPRRWLLAPLILYWIGICVATHVPAARVPSVHVDDKTAHFFGYGILAILLANEVSFRAKIGRGDWVVIWIIAVYGALDEWTQQYFQRTTDLFDWYADMGGAAAGLAFWGLVRWIWHLVQSRRRLQSVDELAISGMNVDRAEHSR